MCFILIRIPVSLWIGVGNRGEASRIASETQDSERQTDALPFTGKDFVWSSFLQGVELHSRVGGAGVWRVVARQTSPKVTSCIPQNSCPAVLHPPRAWHPSLLCLYHTHLMVLDVTPHKVLEDEQYPLWRGKLQVASGISRPLRAALWGGERPGTTCLPFCVLFFQYFAVWHCEMCLESYILIVFF